MPLARLIRPRTRRAGPALAALLVALPLAAAGGQPLTDREARIRGAVARHHSWALDLLERTVNVGSGTLNLAGVKAVGEVLRAELDALGFATRWVDLPPAMRRAGHLVAERRGPGARPDTRRLLLIGHLDTVFEGPGQQFTLADTVALGAGTSDMKGGNTVILLALRALRAVGALDQMHVTVVFTGDEESPGRPIEGSRAALLEAAAKSDVALAFEGGNARTATIARRGASTWTLTVTGRQGHSSGIFRADAGYGAVFEAARILDQFRQRLAGQPFLTFNPAVFLGGTGVAWDSAAAQGTVAGKVNIVPREVVVHGDLRFLTDGQRDSARAVMREVVDQSLPGTSARISFEDGYPGMPPSDGNRELLAVLDGASQALGYPPVDPLPPDRRGAGDIAFVASMLPSLDGLGVDGFGAHSPEEGMYVPSLRMAAERAAVLMARLSAGPAGPAVTGPRPAPDR